MHDCLVKISEFLKKSEPDARMALVWRGKEHLEIFEKVPYSSASPSRPLPPDSRLSCQIDGDDNAISDQVREMLAEQVKDA